jgi:hypothetical protein
MASEPNAARACFAEQFKATVQHHERTTNLADCLPLSFRKSTIVLKSGISRPVSQTNSMLRRHSLSRRRLDWVEIAVNINLPQRHRMVRPAFLSIWLNAAKAELGQVKLIDKDIDRPDRIVLAQILIQPLRKRKCSVCGHRQRQSASSNPPAKSQENHIIEGVFTQLGSK